MPSSFSPVADVIEPVSSSSADAAAGTSAATKTRLATLANNCPRTCVMVFLSFTRCPALIARAVGVGSHIRGCWLCRCRGDGLKNRCGLSATKKSRWPYRLLSPGKPLSDCLECYAASVSEGRALGDRALGDPGRKTHRPPDWHRPSRGGRRQQRI